VLRETTSRSLCGLVCPSRTSELVSSGAAVLQHSKPTGFPGMCVYAFFDRYHFPCQTLYLSQHNRECRCVCVYYCRT
jgi:hypothetical protein